MAPEGYQGTCQVARHPAASLVATGFPKQLIHG